MASNHMKNWFLTINAVFWTSLLTILFDQEQVHSLACVLFEDGVEEGQNYMTLDCFRKQLYRQEGLIENLAQMIVKWLIPTDHNKKRTSDKKLFGDSTRRYLTSEYWQWNKTFLLTILAIVLLLIIIAIERFVYFRYKHRKLSNLK